MEEQLEAFMQQIAGALQIPVERLRGSSHTEDDVLYAEAMEQRFMESYRAAKLVQSLCNKMLLTHRRAIKRRKRRLLK